MTIPTVYTKATLRAYMIQELGSIATALNVDANHFENDEIDDILLMYGVTDISQATNILKIRAIARYMAWRHCWTEVATDYDVTADGQSYKRSQMFDMIERRMDLAKSEAEDYLGDNEIVLGTIKTEQNPYSATPPYFQRLP